MTTTSPRSMMTRKTGNLLKLTLTQMPNPKQGPTLTLMHTPRLTLTPTLTPSLPKLIQTPMLPLTLKFIQTRTPSLPKLIQTPMLTLTLRFIQTPTLTLSSPSLTQRVTMNLPRWSQRLKWNLKIWPRLMSSPKEREK